MDPGSDNRRTAYFTKIKVGERDETDVISRPSPGTAVGAAVGMAVAAMKLSEKEGMHLGQCAAAIVAMAIPGATYPIKKKVGVARIELNTRALPED